MPPLQLSQEDEINSRIFLRLELNPFSPATQVSFTEMSIRGTALVFGLSVFNLLPVRRAVFLSIIRLKQTAGHELLTGVPAGSFIYGQKPLQNVWSGSPRHLQTRLCWHLWKTAHLQSALLSFHLLFFVWTSAWGGGENIRKGKRNRGFLLLFHSQAVWSPASHLIQGLVEQF